MMLGIMQPYFFPYLGYFNVINQTDHWLVFDVVQYTPRRWINRNRILHPGGDWSYINVPLQKFSYGSLISEIFVKDGSAACQRILGQLSHYQGKAPNYRAVTELVREVFSSPTSEGLVDLLVRSMRAICAYLSIPFNYEICSEMGLDLKGIEHPGQWALEISSQLGAQHYINPPAGRDIFSEEAFSQRGIGLHFAEIPALEYECPPYQFIENLSIIDVLMWNKAADVKAYMDSYRKSFQ